MTGLYTYIDSSGTHGVKSCVCPSVLSIDINAIKDAEKSGAL